MNASKDAAVAFATIKELREKLERKEFSAVELLSFFSKRFEQHDAALKSALEIFDAASVMKDARQQGSLFGIPGIAKDVIAQKGRLTTCASKILANYKAVYDATVCVRLKEHGALLLGRANCDEFAMGASNETSAYQKTTNPWDHTKVPGGSSGGPAAAVAAGLVPWALGTETGGSVRQPAAMCGVVGFKPTYGLVSRYGLVAYGSSIDQIAPITRTVYDNALIFSAIAGNDPKDSSSLPVAKKDYTASLTGKLPSKMTIGVVDNLLNAPGIDPEIVAAIQTAIASMEKLGATIRHINLPSLEYGMATYIIVSRAEAASNLARFDGVRYGVRAKGATSLSHMYKKTRHDGFGAEVRRRIMIGNYVLSAGYAGAFYENAKKVQRLMRRDLLEAFKDINLLVMPIHPTPAFTLGAVLDPLQMDLQDLFTCPMNLTGIPAISVPCGFTKNKLPIGFQLVGPDLSEELLYQTAYAYEQQTPWHTMHPEMYK